MSVRLVFDLEHLCSFKVRDVQVHEPNISRDDLDEYRRLGRYIMYHVTVSKGKEVISTRPRLINRVKCKMTIVMSTMNCNVVTVPFVSRRAACREVTCLYEGNRTSEGFNI